MNLSALAAEIGKPDYAGMTNQQIAAAISAKTVSAPDRVVPIAEVMNYLRTNNLWLAIKRAAATNEAAEAAVDLNADLRILTIDFNLPVVVGMLATLVQAALLTAEQSAALTAMKLQTASWLLSINWPADSVTDVDVAIAKASV